MHWVEVSLTKEQENACKRQACEWVFGWHPFFETELEVSDEEWAAWYDRLQDGEIDLLEKTVDADGTTNFAYGLIERFEYQDEAFITEQFFECTSNLLRKEIARQSAI